MVTRRRRCDGWCSDSLEMRWWGVIRQTSERFEVIWNNDSSTSANRHILNIPDTSLEASQVTGRKAIHQYLPQQPGGVAILGPISTKSHRLLLYRPVFPIEKRLENFGSWFHRERVLTGR